MTGELLTILITITIFALIIVLPAYLYVKGKDKRSSESIERERKQIPYIFIVLAISVVAVGLLQERFENKKDTYIQITNFCTNQNLDEQSTTDLIRGVVTQFEQFQITGNTNMASTCLHPSFSNLNLSKFETGTEADLVGFQITNTTDHNLDSQTVTVREQRRSYYKGNLGSTESTTEQFILKKIHEKWLIVSYSRTN